MNNLQFLKTILANPAKYSQALESTLKRAKEEFHEIFQGDSHYFESEEDSSVFQERREYYENLIQKGESLI